MEFYLANYFKPRVNIIVPNISWGLSGMHECDLFIINPSGFCTEVEIKISLADFKKDFEKKHDHSDERIKNFYYAFPHIIYNKNKEFIDKMVPDHAGILIVDNKTNVKIIKGNKSNNTARKLTDKEILKVAKLGCLRIWNLKKKLILLK